MIVCNTRTLRASITGVQRYTIEILKRLPGAVRTVEPPRWMSGQSGHVWEQVVLPIRARGHLLWSPAGTGPVAVANQIVTVHDIAPLDCPEGYSPAFRHWYGFLWRYLLPRVRGLISVSEFTKRRLIEEFGLPADSIHVTPLGVDHERFFPQSADKVQALRRKFALPEKYALFVGAVSARKNMVRLLEAWRQRGQSDVHLVIAGGSGISHVHAGTTLPTLPPNTRLLGKISDEDLPTLLTAARVFAYPSLYEGFGLPPLEAMACGTPCVVANAAALPEVAGPAALQIDPLDVPAIARALDQLLTDDALHGQLRAKGLRHAAGFTWDKTAAMTYEVLARHAG
jgi:glycosyltransferase involved in cell wall biosynthesis